MRGIEGVISPISVSNRLIDGTSHSIKGYHYEQIIHASNFSTLKKTRFEWLFEEDLKGKAMRF